MADITFADYRALVLNRTIFAGPWGRAWQTAMGAEMDAQLVRLYDAARCGWPEWAPADALALLDQILAALAAAHAAGLAHRDVKPANILLDARGEPFVSVLRAYESPETKSVAYTNSCQIGVSVDASQTHAIVVASLDNLVKGASGQAIQNMNLMCGLEETTGLL